MLKKISHIILVSLILVTTMGMTVSKHYCGSSLESVGVLSTPDRCCEIPTGCCHDESFTIKVEDDFSVTSHAFDFTQFAVILPALIELNQIESTEKQSFVSFIVIPPPKIQTVLSSLQTYLL
jgi:hypothetical protein